MTGIEKKGADCLRTRNKYKWVLARVKDGVREFFADNKEKTWLKSFLEHDTEDLRWTSEDFSEICYFDSEDEAFGVIAEYAYRRRCNPRIKDPYDYEIGDAIDSWSYGAVQEFLPEDVLDEIIEMLKNGAPRGEIHKRFGYLLTPISATVLRREYNYFKSLGFGNYKPRKKENEEK